MTTIHIVKENPYADVNITSFIEEVVSDLKHNNLPLLEKIRSIKIHLQ